MPPKKQDTKRLVLIDAHAILHRAYHALPDFSSPKGEPTGALYGLSAMLMKLASDLAPDYMVACYDLPGPTFRHEAYDNYKAQRPEAEEDLAHQMQRSRDIFEAFSIPVYQKEGFEADDIIGTIVAQMKRQCASGAIEIVIASGDMDTLQLVEGDCVRVYTLKKGINDTILYDEKAVKDRYGFAPELIPDLKGLQGDPSDNIPGVAGIGEKTAKALIAGAGGIEAIYKLLGKDEEKLKEKTGVKPRIITILHENEEEALFSKTLATIRLDVPIDFSLPKHTWRDAFDAERVAELFSELNFRTLTARARALAGQEEAEEEERNETPTEHIDPEEVARVGIAVWLLDSNITNPGLEDILQFADTTAFSEARERVFAQLKEAGLEDLYETIELPLRPLLLAAQERGIRLDIPYLKELSSKLHERLETHRAEIIAHAGMDFNLNSPAQLSEVLFGKLNLPTRGIKKTGGGAISTRESELQKLADAHPIIPAILDYRELQKLLSTYIDNLPDLVDEDGRLHTTFIQTGTTTGRLSSANPNLQNIPIKGEHGREIRRAFIASDGATLLAFDYSQIELRILALLSEDTALTKIFQSGGDVHAAVAAQIFGVSADDVTKDQRRKAKVVNFGIVYGMGVTSLQKNLGTSRAEAQSFYDEYFAQFPGVSDYLARVKRETARRGYTETLFGRRRYIEGIHSSIPYVRASAERMAINAPIQGTAADVIKLAMLDADSALTETSAEGINVLLQVHDELIYEARDDVWEKHAPAITRAMANVLSSRGYETIPLVVDASAGKTWGEMSAITS